LALPKLEREGSAASGYELKERIEREEASVFGFRILEQTVKPNNDTNLRGSTCSDANCPWRGRVKELERQLEFALTERDDMRAAFDVIKGVMDKEHS
jgi:hypothetical protein